MKKVHEYISSIIRFVLRIYAPLKLKERPVYIKDQNSWGHLGSCKDHKATTDALYLPGFRGYSRGAEN